MPTEEQLMERRVYRAVQNFMKNEVFGQLADEDKASGWKTWLRKMVIESAVDAYRGFSHEHLVEQTIRREVGAVFDHWRKEGALKDVIEKIIREEAKKIISENLTVSAELNVVVQPRRYEKEAQF